MSGVQGTEHKFLADFQPIGGMWGATILNWISLFGVFFVIGRALKMGLGL